MYHTDVTIYIIHISNNGVVHPEILRGYLITTKHTHLSETNVLQLILPSLEEPRAHTALAFTYTEGWVSN